MVDLLFIGMLYESCVIIITSILLVLIFKKYLIKKHQLTLYLLIIFIFFELAIVFSWLSKIIIIYSDLSYAQTGVLDDPGTFESWFIFRIIEFRFSLVFVSLALLFTYILRVKLFETDFDKIEKLIIYFFGAGTIFYSVIVYQRGMIILDVFAFLLVLVLMALVNIPFCIKTYKAFMKVDNPSFKKGFLSLSIMSLSFILIFVSFLIDRVLILMGSEGFTIFYFLAWTFGVIGIIATYFGYIRPRSGE